jgi:hypothetical protein
MTTTDLRDGAPPKVNSWRDPGPVAAIIAAIIAAVAVVGVAWFEQRRSLVEPAPPTSDTNAAATIDVPSSNQKVTGDRLAVTGTVRGVSPSHSLWCFVRDIESDRWYPYYASRSEDMTWSASVGIGPREKISQPMPLQLHVVVSTSEASSQIADVVRVSARPTYNGLPELPDGARSIAETPVMRVS